MANVKGGDEKGQWDIGNDRNSLFGQPHPLENPVILDHLFKLCPQEIIASSRLTFKQWRDSSLTSWRNSSPLIFHRNNRTPTIYLGKQHTSMNVFWEYYYNPENKCREVPFRSLKFQDLIFNSNNEDHKVLWRVFRNDVRTLEFETCSFPDVDEFRSIIYSSFPNLQKLILKRCYYLRPVKRLEVKVDSLYIEPARGQHPHLKSLEIYEHMDKLPVSILEMLSHFQSITGLIYGGQPGITDPDIPSLLNAIRIIRDHDGRGAKLKLSHFQMLPTLHVSEDPTTQQELSLIQQLNLPLDTFQITLDGAEDFANGILKWHSKTLRSITVMCEEVSPFYWTFPGGVLFQNLDELILLDGVIFKNLDLLRSMPKLSKIVVRDDSRQAGETPLVANTDQLISPTFRLPKLTVLDTNCFISIETLRCLTKIMPNIECLHMVLDDQMFGLVCKKWRMLRRMFVRGTGITDKGVIGTSYSTVDETAQDEQGDDNLERPNITLLQGLEHFSSCTRNMTDASVYNGFLKLPKLLKLSIFFDLGWFGEDAIADLKLRGKTTGLKCVLCGTSRSMSI